MVPFPRLVTALGNVPDPRRAQGKRYLLPYLLLFTVLALMSGARSYRGIITFLEERRDLLNQHFGVALQRAPAVNTLRTVLQSLDAEALERAFRHHARDLLSVVEADGKPMIALDGKTLRGSFDHIDDKKAAQTLTAFATSSATRLDRLARSTRDLLNTLAAIADREAASRVFHRTSPVLTTNNLPQTEYTRPGTPAN